MSTKPVKIQRKRKHGVKAWYRFIRKIINLYHISTLYAVRLRYRFIRRFRFKITRLATFLFFKLWIKEIIGFDNIPSKQSAMLVSNHLSYYDFLILGSLFRDHIVFLAVQKIKQTFFIRWFTKLQIVVYLDREHPGTSFFREVMKHFEAGKLVVIYPEGTRSRTGKMSKPKHGFVKLAMKANVPIIPVAMKGTYEILPPHRSLPRFHKCSVHIGEKMYVSPDNPEFHDIFFQKEGYRKFGDLLPEQMEKIAIRIMEKVRILAEENWDNSIIGYIKEALCKENILNHRLIDRISI